jgi:hypothetical protein
MKTFRIALLITGVLIACLALNTAFAQSVPQKDSTVLSNHPHDPKPKHKEKHKNKNKTDKSHKKDDKQKEKPQKEKEKSEKD